MGLVVYVGTDTKSQMNQQQPAPKTSRLEKKLYQAVLIIFLVKLLICAVLATFAEIWEGVNSDFVDDFTGGGEDAWWIVVFFSYFVLLSYFIPLPLVIACQMIRLMQAQFIEWDPALMTEPTQGFFFFFIFSCLVYQSSSFLLFLPLIHFLIKKTE